MRKTANEKNRTRLNQCKIKNVKCKIMNQRILIVNFAFLIIEIVSYFAVNFSS